MTSESAHKGLALQDRVALIALGGIGVSLVVWLAFSWMDETVQGVALSDELFAPDPHEAMLRLAAVVIVLIATLAIEMLYSRRHQAEESLRLEHATTDALRESEERYRELVECSPDMVLVHRGGRVAYINSRGAQLMGFERAEEVLGTDISRLWSPNSSGISSRELTDVVRTGRPTAPTHVLLRRLDDSLVDVELSLARLTYQGEPAVHRTGHQRKGCGAGDHRADGVL
jgi:PAS domain S-box-containing protein